MLAVCRAECPRMHTLRFLVLTIFCLLLHACIEGDEEVFIYADGSARVKATYRVPSAVLSRKEADEFTQLLEQEVGENKNLRLVTNRVDREQGQRVIRIEIETDDVSQLEGITVDHSSEEERSKSDKILHALLGSIDVQVHGLTASLERRVELKPLFDEYLGKNAAVMLSDAEFRYVVYLPKGAQHSNAHEVSDDGRILRWRYDLSELKGKPISMEMTAPIPLPWWVYAVGVALGLLLLWGVWCMWRKLKG